MAEAIVQRGDIGGAQDAQSFRTAASAGQVRRVVGGRARGGHYCSTVDDEFITAPNQVHRPLPFRLLGLTGQDSSFHSACCERCTEKMCAPRESPEVTTAPLVANGSSCGRKPARPISVLYAYNKDNNIIFGNSSAVRMTLVYTSPFS